MAKILCIIIYLIITSSLMSFAVSVSNMTTFTKGTVISSSEVNDNFRSLTSALNSLGTAALLNVGTSASNVVQLDGTGKLPAVDASALTNLAVAGRNFIINGNFDIWQRAVTGTANVFIADRFRSGALVTSYTQQTASPPVGSFYYGRFVTSGAGQIVRTRLEAVNIGKFAGQTVVLSYYARVAAGTITVTPAIETPTLQDNYGATTVCAANCPTASSVTTSWVRYTSSFTLPAASNLGLQLDFSGASAGTFDITQVQLETGSTASVFEQRNIQTELALCQRFYEKSYDLATIPGTIGHSGAVFVISANAANQEFASVQYSVEKRASPTVTLYSSNSGTSGRIYNTTTGDQVCTIAWSNAKRFNTGGYTPPDQTLSIFHWTAEAEL